MRGLAHLAIVFSGSSPRRRATCRDTFARLLGSGDDLRLAAQASNAWLQAQLLSVERVGLGPANGCGTHMRHGRVAVGRDYYDVPPVRGVYHSNSAARRARGLDPPPIAAAKSVGYAVTMFESE
jgi:transglutaminase-like putative cysteine protease